MKTTSCGLIVLTPLGILLARATGSDRWDLPKGKIEPDETHLDAALRETWEETNLDLSPFRDQLIDLGKQKYLPKKDLYLFMLEMNEPLSLDKCCCHTFIDRFPGRNIPETDAWEWVPKDQILNKVGKSLGRVLVDLGIAQDTKKLTP